MAVWPALKRRSVAAQRRARFAGRMRYLAVLLLLSCGGQIPAFVRADAPERPCAEACMVGEQRCIIATSQSRGYFWLGPFIVGGETADRGLRFCAVSGRLCEAQCARTLQPGVTP